MIKSNTVKMNDFYFWLEFLSVKDLKSRSKNKECLSSLNLCVSWLHWSGVFWAFLQIHKWTIHLELLNFLFPLLTNNILDLNFQFCLFHNFLYNFHTIQNLNLRKYMEHSLPKVFKLVFNRVVTYGKLL